MFEEFLAGLDTADAAALRAVVDRAQALVPEATEGRSYGLPALRYRDKPLLGFGIARNHLAVHPFSPAVVEAVAAQLDASDLSKGTIRFRATDPLPEAVVDQIVQLRRAEIDGS